MLEPGSAAGDLLRRDPLMPSASVKIKVVHVSVEGIPSDGVGSDARAFEYSEISHGGSQVFFFIVSLESPVMICKVIARAI
jgi:hypothetical protein